MKSLRYIFLFGIVLLLFSCKKFKGSQEVPAYLRIEPWSFTTNYDVEGAPTNGIIDAWLYINGSFQGCYELRGHDDGVYVQIPVLEEGEKTLQLYPGIKMNSISSTRVQYPFYKPYKIQHTFVKGETATISPSTRYYSVDSTGMVFRIEDFEYYNTIELHRYDTTYAELYQISHRSDTNAWINPYDLADSNFHYKSGHVHLADSTLRFFLVSPHLTDLPSNGRSSVFLEIDYKCGEDFLVGLLVRSPQDGVIDKQLVYLRATNVWKKAYINFTPTIIENYNALYFQYYLKGTVGQGETADFYFDNIKLIYN